MTIDVSIVIPAFNESTRLANGYDRLSPVLERMGVERCEIIVVDDGSGDDTMIRAHEVYGHLPETLFVQQPHNLGKGAALRLGMGLARGAHVITADADMAIDPSCIPTMIEHLREAPIAPGSRTEQGAIRYDSRLRTVAGGAFNRLVRHYTGTQLRDTQCGCKGFQAGAARVIALVGMIDRFAFDAELLFVADRLDLAVRPVHVTWRDVEGSSVRVGHDSFEMLRDMRGLSRTRYENPVVQTSPDVAIEPIAQAARAARVHGLAVARGADDALVVLPRDGALGGLGIAATLGGTLRVAGLDELRGRRFEAV